MNEILFLWRKITREVELEKVQGKEQSLEDKFNLLNARCALNTLVFQPFLHSIRCFESDKNL